MRKLDLQEFVDEIYEDCQSNKDTEYVFFLGAGCSKSSGIKLASELAEEWYEELKKQKSKFDKFNIKYKDEIKKNAKINFGNLYFEIFEALYPTPLAQQKKIQKITEDRTPSLGYYVLSELMQKTSFNTVITTNFDNLIQDALIYSGNKRALVITHQDLAKFIKRDNTPMIIKIHGDAHIHPFNNSNNTKKIPDELSDAIQGLSINTKFIFIGYRGDDESIKLLLDDCKRIDQVYWFASNEPKDVKLEKWWKNLNIKTYIKERDFDKIMALIKSKFDLKEPNFQDRATLLENSYRKALEEETNDLEAIEKKDKTYIDYLILGNTYYSQKEYKKAIEAYEKSTILNPKNDSAFNNWGTALYNLAKQNNDESLYKESFTKYEKATILNPKDDSAFYNWGNSLSDLAKQNNDESLYKESFTKYEKATNLNPKNDSAFNNWGTALYNLAKQNNDESLYKESFTKYEKATNLNPKNDSAFYNWGSALYYLAKQNNDESLYKESFTKYEKATILNPKDDFAFNGWGNALYYLAKQNNDESLYKESFTKYEKATILNPKNDSAFNGWGSSLTFFAKLTGNTKLYKNVLEKYEKAFNINKEEYNLSCIHSLMENKDKALEYLENSLKNNEIKSSFVLEDEDWENYKDDSDFLELIKKY